MYYEQENDKKLTVTLLSYILGKGKEVIKRTPSRCYEPLQGTGEKSFKNEDVHWHEACQHALKNIGETDVKFLVISFKKINLYDFK